MLDKINEKDKCKVACSEGESWFTIDMQATKLSIEQTIDKSIQLTIDNG
jgi:pyrroloquinoline quinone (PQQ) biosynthesis protein C